MTDALRLPLTLIPEPMWRMNVRTALPDRWDEIRHEVYRRAAYRCEACGSDGGSRPLHAHEYWGYEGGRQVLTNIACLCDVSHSATHLGRTLKVSGSDGATRQALQHLATVNGWSLQQAAAYARVELARTAERSQRQWRLDLSLLESEFGIRVPSELGGPARGGVLRRLLGAA